MTGPAVQRPMGPGRLPLLRRVVLSRARWASGFAVLMIVSPFVVWPFAAAGITSPGLMLVCAFVGGPVGLLLHSELGQELRLIACSMSAVTARTLTGERTVDLRRLTRVRLRVSFSYGRAYRTLVVRDVHGVSLGLTSERSRRAVKRAVERLPAHAYGANESGDSEARPSVSAAARASLGLEPHPSLIRHTLVGFLLLTVGTTLYLSTVLRLAAGY